MHIDWAKFAADANDEGECIDFKSEGSPGKPEFWCETVKDLVSFANSRGGIIIFGLDSNGTPSDGDCSSLERLDNADIQNQVYKYTGITIQSISTLKVVRNSVLCLAISVEAERTLIPFIKPGTYEPEHGKQKTTFSQGTIYVRHGSKSEACSRDDLRAWLERELIRIREDWLTNIRKVVEAPLGHAVVVVSNATPLAESGATISARLTTDPNAIAVRLQNPKKDWPHRQIDVMNRFNAKDLGCKINSHDLVAIKYVHKINESTTPDLMLKTHRAASPQYSDQFIDWLAAEYTKDSNLFVNARSKWRNEKYGR